MKPNALKAVLETLQEVDGELKGSIYFAKFNKTVSLRFESKLREHVKRYIETFLDWGENLFKKLQDSSYKYCQDLQPTFRPLNCHMGRSG